MVLLLYAALSARLTAWPWTQSTHISAKVPGMDRQQLRETLLDVLEQETWERPANLGDNVKIRQGLKLDSVDLLSVMLRVETQLSISLNSRDFEKVVTVGDLLDVIQAKLAETASRKAA
jgi:acyl carrier protein